MKMVTLTDDTPKSTKSGKLSVTSKPTLQSKNNAGLIMSSVCVTKSVYVIQLLLLFLRVCSAVQEDNLLNELINYNGVGRAAPDFAQVC